MLFFCFPVNPPRCPTVSTVSTVTCGAVKTAPTPHWHPSPIPLSAPGRFPRLQHCPGRSKKKMLVKSVCLVLFLSHCTADETSMPATPPSWFPYNRRYACPTKSHLTSRQLPFKSTPKYLSRRLPSTTDKNTCYFQLT